jgi:membrane-bound serine protease (ClpP class)
MTAYLWPIVLQLLGVAVVIAEIILPSGGLLSLLAAVLFGYSLYLVFQGLSAAAGFVFVAIDIVMIPVLIVVGLRLLARSPATLSTELSSREGFSSQPPELTHYLAKEGRAVTDLRPSGLAVIEGRRLDVVSRGEYIEKDAGLVVTAVTANQIVVKKK